MRSMANYVYDRGRKRIVAKFTKRDGLVMLAALAILVALVAFFVLGFLTTDVD